MNYYEILGIDKIASREVVYDAYNKLRESLLAKEKSDTKEITQLLEIYTTLSHGLLRADYDFFLGIPQSQTHINYFYYHFTNGDYLDLDSEYDIYSDTSLCYEAIKEQYTSNEIFNVIDNHPVADYVEPHYTYLNLIEKAKEEQKSEIERQKVLFYQDYKSIKYKYKRFLLSAKETLITVSTTLIFTLFILGYLFFMFGDVFLSTPTVSNGDKVEKISSDNTSNQESTTNIPNSTFNSKHYDFDLDYSSSYDDTYDESIETIVYITRTGSKYHNYNCQYLRQSCYSIDLDDAIYDGYEPCSVCNPPW